MGEQIKDIQFSQGVKMRRRSYDPEYTFHVDVAVVAVGAQNSEVATYQFIPSVYYRVLSFHLFTYKTATAGGAITPAGFSRIAFGVAAGSGPFTLPDSLNPAQPVAASFPFGPSSPKFETNLLFIPNVQVTLNLTAYQVLALNDTTTFSLTMEWRREIFTV